MQIWNDMVKYTWCVNNTYCVTAGGHIAVNMLKTILEKTMNQYNLTNN